MWSLILVAALVTQFDGGGPVSPEEGVGSGGGTFVGNVCFNDDVELQFGSACGDHTLYSDGTDAFLDIGSTAGLMLSLSSATVPSPDGNMIHIFETAVGGNPCGSNDMMCFEKNGTAYTRYMIGGAGFGGFQIGDATNNSLGGIIYGGSVNATDPNQFRLKAAGTRILDIGVGVMEHKQATTYSTTAGDLIFTPAGMVRLLVSDVALAECGAATDVLCIEKANNAYTRTLIPANSLGAFIVGEPANDSYGGIYFGMSAQATYADEILFTQGGGVAIMTLKSGETEYQQAQTIKTTAGDLTLTPAGGTTTITGDLVVTGNFASADAIYKSYSHTTGASGTHYMAGYYDAPATDVDLTQGSTTAVLGAAADGARGSHAFLVASGAGSTDGSTLIVTASGTSITDAGVRSTGDSEVVIGAGADLTACQINATAATENLYCETDKKWLGAVTYTLSSSGGATFSFTFNIGFTKYDDYGNVDFTTTDFECVFDAGATDTGINIQLLHHKEANWDYDATGFVPGSDEIVGMATDYSTDAKVTSGETFAYKRAGISQAVTGSGSEGIVIKLTTASVNTFDALDCHVGVTK